MEAEAESLSAIDVIGEFMALSVVEASFVPSMLIEVAKVGTKMHIRDTGRGMQIRPDRGDKLPHATRAMISYYPCLPDDHELEARLNQLVWKGRGSLGPAVANLACSHLSFTSHREGVAWKQSFSWGKPDAPLSRKGPTTHRGTEITFETKTPVCKDHLTELANSLCELVNDLTIRVI